jgi:hypothetical protein
MGGLGCANAGTAIDPTRPATKLLASVVDLKVEKRIAVPPLAV